MNDSLTSNYIVHSYLCNNKARLRLSSIAMFFQESAWEHAESCGAGYETLKPYGLLWILHGLRIEVSEFPGWNEKLKLETWGKKYENLFAYRDFEIFHENQDLPIIKATSSWLLVDAKTHRPVRITDELKKIPPLSRQAMKDKPGAIDLIDSFNLPDFNRSVFYSDIDIYNHVNNTRYIQFCIDSCPDVQEHSNEIKLFDIRFVQETRIHDSLIIKARRDGNSFLFLGAKSEDNKEVFRAKLELKR